MNTDATGEASAADFCFPSVIYSTLLFICVHLCLILTWKPVNDELKRWGWGGRRAFVSLLPMASVFVRALLAKIFNRKLYFVVVVFLHHGWISNMSSSSSARAWAHGVAGPAVGGAETEELVGFIRWGMQKDQKQKNKKKIDRRLCLTTGTWCGCGGIW